MGNVIGSALGSVLNMFVSACYYTLQPFWLRLWPPVQVFYFICKRVLLRERNITSPTLPPATAITEGNTPADRRTFEGSLNSQDRPTMAMTGCPFIRWGADLDRICLPRPLRGADHFNHGSFSCGVRRS